MSISSKQLANGFTMPIFGLGTWLFGGGKERDPFNPDEEQIQAIKRAIASGITHIDTAENYAQGHAEKLVGKAIGSVKRDILFLTSKVDKSHLRYDELLRSFNSSLQRLKTDYLDLYLIHAPNVDIPLAESIRALDRLVDEGLVKNIGVSNFTTKRLIEAQNLSTNKIVVNQVYYNLINREPEKDGLLEYCQHNDVILEAYRPLERGDLLTHTPEIMNDIGKKYGKTPAQVAINWLITQKNVTTISRVTSQSHTMEILGALNWQMAEDDVENLRTHYPNQTMKSELLPLR